MEKQTVGSSRVGHPRTKGQGVGSRVAEHGRLQPVGAMPRSPSWLKTRWRGVSSLSHVLEALWVTGRNAGLTLGVMGDVPTGFKQKGTAVTFII